jgi:hypothetical protein
MEAARRLVLLCIASYVFQSALAQPSISIDTTSWDFGSWKPALLSANEQGSFGAINGSTATILAKQLQKSKTVPFAVQQAFNATQTANATSSNGGSQTVKLFE